MTRDQIVDRAEARFQDSTNLVFTVQEWRDFVNDAYADVVTARPDWPFNDLRSTTVSVDVTAASATYGSAPLPADTFRVSAVHDTTNKQKLEQLDGIADYRNHFPDPSSTGAPSFYRLRNTRLEVYPYPTPGSALTLAVDYYGPPAELTNGTDEPVFPEQYHRILVYGALAHAYEDDGQPDEADRYQARFNRLLGLMIQDLMGPRGERYPGIVDNFFG